MTKSIEIEIQKRTTILREIGMKAEVDSAYRCGAPLCSIMFRLGNVYSDVIATVAENEQFAKVKEDFEVNYEAVVYYGIYSEECDGKQLAFIYVSESDANEWESERKTLRTGTPLAYIYNFTERFDDISQITIAARNGVIIRI